VAVELQYQMTLDGRRWIPIPFTFPWSEFATAEEWASTLASDLLAGTGAESTADALTQEALTLQAAPPPIPGAQERFWRTEYVGGYPIIIHLYIDETWATTAEDLLQYARLGIGGFVQTWSIVEGTAFDVAVNVAVSAEIEDVTREGSPVMTIGAVRSIGVRDGLLFLIDYLDEDPVRLEAVQPELEEIFRSFRFRAAPPSAADA